MLFSARRILFLLPVLLALPFAPARAADVEFPVPDSAVNHFGITTYLDLARQFVPDIKGTDNGYVGTRRAKLRHIGGKEYEDSDADSFGFYDISQVRMKAAGKDRLLVLFDFAQAAKTTQGLAVLALYDATHQPVLLDAADIGFDQSTFFFDQGLMPIAEGSDAILTMSSHFNSSQTYTIQSMIMVRNDKLELIDTALLFNDRICGADRQQNIRYAANPGEGKPYAPIAVMVTETTTPIDEICNDITLEAAGKKETRVTYTWNSAKAKYLPDSDALEKLARENESRF